MFHITGLDHIALTVRNQNTSLEWYQRVLGMERRYEEANGADDPVFVCAGNACLALFPAQTSDQRVLAMRHFAFRLDRANFERARAELSEQQIPFRFEDHTIAHSMYLADPDGYRVELTTYELSREQMKAHRATAKPGRFCCRTRPGSRLIRCEAGARDTGD